MERYELFLVVETGVASNYRELYIYKSLFYVFLYVFKQEGIEAEKQTIALLSKLRNELQTDKPIAALTDGLHDAESWNQYLQRHQRMGEDEESVSWFKSPWLYVECYMYRRIQEAVWLKWEADTLTFYDCPISSFWGYVLFCIWNHGTSILMGFSACWTTRHWGF